MGFKTCVTTEMYKRKLQINKLYDLAIEVC